MGSVLETPCREWQGPVNNYGYGRRAQGQKSSRFVHRQIMELAGHEVAGRVVMHLCDNPRCFRYDHLRVADQSANIQDAADKKRHVNAAKTHCPKGHPLDGKLKDGRRRCLTCHRIREAARHHRKRKG